MYDNMHIQTVAKDFSRSREPPPVLDDTRAEQSDHKGRINWDSIEFRQVACLDKLRVWKNLKIKFNAYEGVSWITNSYPMSCYSYNYCCKI